MRKIFSIVLKLVGAIVLGFIMFGTGRVFYDTHQYKAFHNPEHVPNLTRYLEHYGDPEDRMFLVWVGENQYYELIPRMGEYAAWVSGPPIFLYDLNGKLRDYNPDSGDADFVKGGPNMARIKREGKVNNPMQLIQKIMGGHK